MPNNYSQGTVSPYIPLTEQQHALLRWDHDDAVLDADGDWIEEDEKLAADNDETLRARAALDRLANELKLDDMYQRAQIDNNVEPGKSYVYYEFGADEGSAVVLQHILKSLPDEYTYLVLEGASYCQRMRQGEFGGWCCLITRDDIRWMNTSEWILRTQKADLDKKQSETPGHWSYDPEYPIGDWQLEVANGYTRLGYHDWVAAQKENADNA